VKGLALVTGGAGFIGSTLVRALLAEGWQVRVFDNLSTGKVQNLAGLTGPLELIEGDITDYPSLEAAMVGVSRVFHLAAVASVQRSIVEPLRTHAVNVDGTHNVYQAALAAKVPKVVTACSAAAYGLSTAFPLAETERPTPISPYGAHKVFAELASAVLTCPTTEFVCLRFFNVYGPRQDPKSEYAAVVPRFVTAVLTGVRPVFYGDGLQSRDFCFVEDVARANLLAAATPGLGGRVINVASGRESSLRDLLGAICAAAGRTVEPILEPARGGDIRRSMAQVGLASQLLGFKAAFSLEEGLARTVAWYKENPVAP
jgi:nucleoside-diphosphate-sugar epimerase